MSSLLQQLDIFELRPLLTNFNCKLSTITEYDSRKQLLCMVSEDNDIVLRYTNENGLEVLKLISWFRRTSRVIHDVCFDPSGSWLLVLCFDNTLHIVPALAVVDKLFLEAATNSIYPHPLYSTSQVTSYIIPFVGPHECPDSKKCPNRVTKKQQSSKNKNTLNEHKSGEVQDESVNKENINELAADMERLQVAGEPCMIPAAEHDEEDDEDSLVIVPAVLDDCSMETFSHDIPAEMLATAAAPANQPEDRTGNSQLPAMNMSFMASTTCPYPLSVVWWRTLDGINRAVIGYSDGSICFVGLSPNCPFVASTAIESGSVVKLLICRDNTFDSVMMIITSSLKQQFKLLLEQKAIKYVYPGEISPTNMQSRESDWQIIMPIKNTKNAMDISQMDDDVFLNNEAETAAGSASNITNATTTTQSAISRPTVQPPPAPINFSASTSTAAAAAITAATELDIILDAQPPPPPPPYSVAITRQLDSNSIVTTTSAVNNKTTSTIAASLAPATSSSQQQQQTVLPLQQQDQPNDLDETNNRAGILPAARARLASLKSLGSKKLNAIKMRLSDNRQKLEEYIPENSLASSFAIMDSPSLTPELLANSIGSFYTIQNLRSTYLLSALHSQSNSLSVHSIDINLKPLFLYKIPPVCVDILISSNILYSIQYVDINDRYDCAAAATAVSSRECNTEKENRDKDLEKLDLVNKINEENLPIFDLVDEIVDNSVKPEPEQKQQDGDSLAGTSAASSSSSEQASPGCMTPSNCINAVGVISSAMASLRTGDEDKFNVASQLGLFRFEHETVLSLYQMAIYRPSAPTSNENISKEVKPKINDCREIRSPMDYVNFYEHSEDVQEELSLRQIEIMQNEFPKINYDPCYVVTNKNVYFIQLKKEPFAIFLEAALNGEWTQCREFCNTFDLTYEACIEFAGDYLLRRKKVTQALLTYNTARIKPIRTALKLAMFGQTTALMHLCAMALKLTYVLKSRYFCHPIIKTMLSDITYRHSEDVRGILPPTPLSHAAEDVVVNEGLPCSDYTYGVDESLSQLQMSPSSQFHLANLLLITLAEKAVNDKNYMPLWNFLVTNSKYHTNMTSIVLCQSGLFSAALLLAKMRGVCIDTFLALTSVVGQEFGWYTELNVCLYNLSEPMFTETITYLPSIAVDYFAFIQDKLPQIRPTVLKRLEHQLNPFAAILRPIVSHTSSSSHSNDNNTYLFEFCKNLIETYLAVLIHLESQRSKCDRILNALNTFRLTYEDNQFAIENSRFKPISAGCAHCACVVDGVAYFWGSNGVPCNYSVNKSSEPPEPPYAVKSLDVLSQLNLEVHAVKCGRQHTLVLTNNGLYSLGNNNLCQLGIGKEMQMSMQPMLVKAFDTKNITILEAGQYHNAAVADGQIYTWGWGIYGQLGHGSTENVAQPTLVSFFKFKKVLQVSLGHAHSLVLCEGANKCTELYVFGSNHFGQLGLGGATKQESTANDTTGGTDELGCSGNVKQLLPQKLDVCPTTRIRLIHTKFFTNLVVDEHECMYTWGSSPQALRLANQIKRRANAKQKSEEHQRREMSKRFEATIINNENASTSSSAAATQKLCEPSTSAVAANLADAALSSAAIAVPKVTFTPPAMETLTEEKSIAVASIVRDKITQYRSDAEVVQCNAQKVTASTIIADDNVASKAAADINLEIINEVVTEIPPVKTEENIQEELEHKPFVQTVNVTIAENASTATTVMASAQTSTATTEVDPCEHMSPHQVDTSEVAGQILQISSGLFHFALISSSCTLYTWGKNLEHQLGTEDKERRAVGKPSPIDNIERPMYVDCGADFTLVMTTDFIVKAFGGNSNGQCGRDLGASIDKGKQRVVCLPATKRLMRFESQCVEVPVEINLPRPRIRLDTEPVRYLKSIPRFHSHFVQEADIEFDNCAADNERNSLSLSQQHYKSTTQADSSENAMTGQESDDLISSLENISQNDASSLQLSLNVPLLMDNNSNNGQNTNSSYECTPEEHSYNRLDNASLTDNGLMGNIPNATRQSDASLLAAKNDGIELGLKADNVQNQNANNIETAAAAAADDEESQQLSNYIHYCLYIFHGLYNPDKVRDFSKERLEYRIRSLMLNFKFIEAFSLCLQRATSPAGALKLFEYFARDTGYVPMRRSDLKFLIYYLFNHFIQHQYDMTECERFFLNDLDYYILELSYVLYFNNNNSVLEQNLNEKFKHLIAQSVVVVGGGGNSNHQQQNQQQQQQQAYIQNQLITTSGEEIQPTYKLEDTDVIFEMLSVKFKTIVCQRLLKYCNN